MNRKEFSEKFAAHLKSLFLSGLFTILPVFFTVFVVTFTYSFVARWLCPLRRMLPTFLQKIPGTEFVLVMLAIFFIGFLIRFLFITPLIRWGENLIHRIPLIRNVYSASKALVNFFNFPEKLEQKRKVILIEFPKKGFFHLAFLIGSAPARLHDPIPQEKLTPGKKYYKVFMPNSPNPTSGYFLTMSEDEIIPTDLTFEEAIRALVSCGLITPDTLTK